MCTMLISEESDTSQPHPVTKTNPKKPANGKKKKTSSSRNCTVSFSRHNGLSRLCLYSDRNEILYTCTLVYQLQHHRV